MGTRPWDYDPQSYLWWETAFGVGLELILGTPGVFVVEASYDEEAAYFASTRSRYKYSGGTRLLYDNKFTRHPIGIYAYLLLAKL